MEAYKEMRVVPEEDSLNRFQDNVKRGFMRIDKKDIIDGVHIVNQSVGPGSVTLTHGLDRQVNGYIITSASTKANAYKTNSDNNQITLYFDNNGTFNIWVF